MATIYIGKGDTLTLSAEFADTDLTDWEWAITVKKDLADDDTDAVLWYGWEAVTAEEIAASTFSHAFDPDETILLDPGNYFYDMAFKTDDDVVFHLPIETLEIGQVATKRTEGEPEEEA